MSGRRRCEAAEYPGPLLAIAGHRLPGATPEFGPEPLDDSAWRSALAAAGRHRVSGLLAAAVRDGAMPATRGQAEQARTAHRVAQLRVLTLERELVAVVDRLGVDCRVLKGSAVAHLDYPDPALRAFNDLDILVRPSDVDRAAAALSSAGYRRTLAEPRPGFDRRFDKGMTLRSPDHLELDLHRTFVLGPWGVVVDLDSLWDDGQEFTVGGRTIRALSAPNRFLHACYHAALGDWPLRLGSLRDVAQLLAHVDATAVRRVAAAWRAEAVVAAAVSDTRRLLGTTSGGELGSWADAHRPTKRELRWLALHNHPDKTFSAQALATLRVLPWRDKAAYARALVLPDRRYTAGRHGSTLGRFAYAVNEVRKGRA